jgi:hypothetical protein
MRGVDKVSTDDGDPNPGNIGLREDENLLIEGRDLGLNRTPVCEDDFLGYFEDGRMLLVKNSPGPTDQDYDRFADELVDEFGLEFGAYLDENGYGEDTVGITDVEEAVSHLDPNYVVGRIDGENGHYTGVKPV